MSCLVQAIVASLSLGAVPDPYVRSDQPTIGPAPVPVMEQTFWVQLKLDPATEVKVECPPRIRLLDKTKPDKGRGWTRFYFRADAGVPEGAIAFTPAGAGPVRVPVRVLSYREDVEDKSRDLPGFTTAAAKKGRSYYTDEMVAQAKANLAAFPGLKESISRPTRFDAMTDEELWKSLPSWNVPRQLYGDWPCPFCGEKIYQKSAFYPWRTAGPFHCKCPLCERVFPSNDVSKDDYTSGDFPDDGWGYDSTGSGRRMDAHGWVGYAVERDWLARGRVIHNLALRRLLLGDAEAGHRAGVLLARMAYVYPGMDMHWQQTKSKYLRVGKTSTEQQFDAGQLMVPALQAYDALWEYLTTDQKLADFLRTRDPSVRTPEDVRSLIDVYLVQHVGLNFMRRWYHGDNGGWEMRTAQVALLANMASGQGQGDVADVSNAWVREIFTHAYNTNANEGGLQDSVLINYLTREGHTNIGALSYSAISLQYMDELAGCLARYPDPKWRTLCNLYDEKRFPRVRAMFDVYLDSVVAGHFLPNYGDDGGGRDSSNFVPARRGYYLRAYEHWPTDRFARELARIKEREPELFAPNLWPRIDEHARRLGPPAPARSRVLDGVGMVFLESRAGEPDLKARAGLALRYGYSWGHSHHDNLNVQFWAKGLCLAPELGYPNWVHPLGATGQAVHHVTGMIDNATQYAGATAKGALEVFAGAPEASFVDCSARPAGFDAQVYRRGAALLDAPDGDVYVFDVLRLKGGSTRTYCFHGPDADDFQCALAFGEKGEPIFGNLMEPQRAGSDDDVTAVWKCKGRPERLRVRLLGRPGREYVTARFGKVDSPPFRFLLAQDAGKGEASEFVALWEPCGETPVVEKVERLAVEGGDEPEGFRPVALRVTLAGGRTDTLLYAFNPSAVVRAGDIEFAGSFGYVSEQDGKLRCLHLVNGRLLEKSGAGVRSASPAYRGRITAVDLRENRATLDVPLPADGCLDGRPMNIVAGGEHRVSYRIERVLPPGNVVQLGLPAKIYQSKLTSVDEAGRKVNCEVAPPIEAVRRFPPGYYNGALLTDEGLTARYRVRGVDQRAVALDRPPRGGDFLTTDEFGRPMVHIFDFGEGDEATVCGSVFLRRGEDGGWELETTADTEVRLDDQEGRAGEARVTAAGGGERGLEGRKVREGVVSYAIPLASLSAGRGTLRVGPRPAP